MSKESTEQDVRVVLYDTSKQKMAYIMFFNDTELLLDCERVKIFRDGDKLYFTKGDGNIPGSVKLSGKRYDVLQIVLDYNLLIDLEGNYDLKCDTYRQHYYISKSEKLSDYEHVRSIKDCKQLNHNPGVREKGVYKKGESSMTAILTDKGKKVAENAIKQKQQQKKTAVVKALWELLKVQVTDNEDALSTIELLEKYIKL